MSEINDLHEKAMDFTARAFMARMYGNTEQAAEFFKSALDHETAAIDALGEYIEPTFSVLHRSAATLALDCKLYHEAEHLAANALAKGPPEEIAEELRDVLAQANSLIYPKTRDEHQVTTDGYEAQAQLKEQAFDEERRKLEEVTRYIEEQQLRLEAQMPATAYHQQTADAIQGVLDEQSDIFWVALRSPYFGRLDYYHRRRDDPEPGSQEFEDTLPEIRSVYLGGASIRAQNVFNWTAPIGQLWYTQSRDDGYTAPRGYIPTRVVLKRHLRIRDGELEDVADVFGGARHAILSAQLSETGLEDGHLTVIIETIEPEQYESIANVTDEVLIVQGAAGSGKSEIGLHRIAFLLSPFNMLSPNERPTPETTLLVGPSQAFLDNVDDVLPNLGVADGVERVRFSEWLSSKLSSRQVRFNPRIWNNLLRGGELNFNEAAETFKGSLYMADAMDRRVSELAREFRNRCLALGPMLDRGSGVDISKKETKDALDEILPRYSERAFLNRRRERFIDRICELVERNQPSARRSATRPSRVSPERMRSARHDMEDRRRAIRNAVVDWCGSAWPEIDFRREYTALLSNPGEMARLTRGRLPEETALALAESANNNTPNTFGDSDAGAVAYLDHLLNGTIESRYRHVVVDEAQDISPIEFKLLSESSSNNWFTILGDTAQRLTPYTGVRSWREVERVFGRFAIKVQHARKSYRSTRQITTFTNRILRTFDKNVPSPIAFEREGERVEYNRHANTSNMYQAMLDDIVRIRKMNGLENAVIAILARDVANMNRFQAFCDERGIDDIARVETENHSGSRTILARIPDVKGLEYDAVIVMGVNDSFSDTLFNKKLLYMATTRAKHFLSIHWSGARSPILNAVSERGLRNRMRR